MNTTAPTASPFRVEPAVKFGTASGVYRQTYSTENFEVQIEVQTNSWLREARKKARVYVSGETDVDFAPAYDATRADAERLGRTPIRGDNPETDKLFDSLNRQIIKNQRATVAEALADVPELAEILGSTKIGFSRHAGCSCSCSPGFVVAEHITAPYFSPYGLANVAEGNVTLIFITRKTS